MPQYLLVTTLFFGNNNNKKAYQKWRYGSKIVKSKEEMKRKILQMIYNKIK